MASGRRSYSASPTALSVGPAGDNRFELSAAAGFRGPGALLVEVTTARDSSGNEDTSTTDDGATVLLSIPVQVGDDTPVLECPSTVIPISAGQEYDLDIANFCTVFTLDPRDAAGLGYEATWASALDGLDAGSPQGSVVPVSAAEDATRGGEAVLSVRAGESNTEEVRFRLAQAPPPTLSPVRVETMEAGTSRTYDLASYLQAGVAQPEPTIVSVRSQGNSGVRATTSGSRLTLTAAKDSRGVQASFTIVMSDVGSSDPPPERVAQGRIQFEVVGTPSAPGAPRPFSKSQSETITMSWEPPSDDGGAPILYYNVKEQRKGAQQRCDTNTCVFRKLKNGGSYSFRVQAVNRVGPGEWSEESEQARADTEPGRVENIRMVDRGDGTITVAWDKPRTQTSKVLDYTLTWAGGQQTVSGGDELRGAGPQQQREVRLHRQGAQQGRLLGAQVVARDAAARHPARSGCTVGDRPRGQAPTRPASVSPGAAVLPEGPGPTVYTVSYTQRFVVRGGAGVPEARLPHVHPLRRPLRRARSSPTRVASPTTSRATGRSRVRALPSRPWDARPQWGGLLRPPRPGTTRRCSSSTPCRTPEAPTAGSRSWSAGLVNRTFSNQTGSIVTRVQVPSNEQSYPVQLRVCNEKAPAGCTLSSQQNVQSLRPPRRKAQRHRPGRRQRQGHHLEHHRHQQRRRRRSWPSRSTAGAEQVDPPQRCRARSASRTRLTTETTSRTRPSR